MIRARLSLSALMLSVAVLALDFVAFRAISGAIADPSGQGRRGAYCLLGLLPVLNAAALGSAMLAGSLRARGPVRPFATGFVAASSIAALCYAVACSLWDLPGGVFGFLQPWAPPIDAVNASVTVHGG